MTKERPSDRAAWVCERDNSLEEQAAEVASLTARIGEFEREIRTYVDGGWLLYIEDGQKVTFEVKALRVWADRLARLRAEHETP